jgi:hypothetical protein
MYKINEIKRKFLVTWIWKAEFETHTGCSTLKDNRIL